MNAIPIRYGWVDALFGRPAECPFISPEHQEQYWLGYMSYKVGLTPERLQKGDL